MADCMGCDEEIAWETDECPHCGLEAPVERRWYVESFQFNRRKASKPFCFLQLKFLTDFLVLT